MPNRSRAAIDQCSVRCLARETLRSPQRRMLRVATSRARSAATADATTDLHAVDPQNLAGRGPILSIPDEPGAYGIFTSVIPFLRVRLIASQQVIVKAWLPEGAQLLPGNLEWLVPRRGKRPVQMSFQPFEPSAEGDLTGSTEPNDEMDVIRHQHVSPDSDDMFGTQPAVIHKRRMNLRRREQVPPCVRVESNEEQRRVVLLENSLQARRLAFPFQVHKKRCSVRCPQRTSSPVSHAADRLRTADSTTTRFADAPMRPASRK